MQSTLGAKKPSYYCRTKSDTIGSDCKPARYRGAPRRCGFRGSAVASSRSLRRRSVAAAPREIGRVSRCEREFYLCLAGENDTMGFFRQAAAAAILVTLTLVTQSAEWGRSSMGKSSIHARIAQAWSIALRRTHSSIHECDDGLPSIADSAMGQFLPLELLSVVGKCILFFRSQLFHGRLWRSGPPEAGGLWDRWKV